MSRPLRSEMKCAGSSRCENPVYAKGYCNAHYLRVRSGKDMDDRIQQKKDGGRKCSESECDRVVGRRGAYDMCHNHYVEHRARVRRSLYIRAMGPECQMCGELFPPHAYDFHHVDKSQKENQISAMFRDASDKRLSEEISKCILLCAVCHRIEHYGPI